MTQVDEGKSEMMACQEISRLQVKTNQQGTKLVKPVKGRFDDKAVFVNLGVEAPFSTGLTALPIAFVLCHVRDDPMNEAHFARLAGIKGASGIQDCASDNPA